MLKKRRSRRSWLPRAVSAPLVIGLAAGLAACSSASGGTTGGTTVAAADSPGLKAAQALVDAHIGEPTTIGPTQPVGKPIPAGKHIVVVYADPSSVATNLVDEAFDQAARVLGWNVTAIHPAAFTPQDLQQALSQAARLHPDAVLESAADEATVQRQMDQLYAMHVPVLASFSPDPAGGPLTVSIDGFERGAALARISGAEAVVDSHGHGNFVEIGIEGARVVQEYLQGFSSEVHQTCPACTVTETELPVADQGTAGGQDIVNYLRAHPSISGIMLGYSGLGANLYAAAKSVGFTLPKVYSIGTVPTDIEAAREGELTGTIPEDYNLIGWQTADALARIFTGQTSSALSQDSQYENAVIWSNELHNVPQPPTGNTFPATVANYQAQFEKLWGK